MGYTMTMQVRSKPRLRLQSDGKWYCHREHRTAFGLYMGRTTGAGNTPAEAWADLALLERQHIEQEMGVSVYGPPRR